MAAGEGTRLLPLTEHWPKPVLPIDGRPVLAVLLRELAAADLDRVWLVTGYLADQVEGLAGDGSAFGIEVTFVHQPDALGSADAVRRALGGGGGVPALVSAADTVYSRGDIARFAAEFAGSGAAGAVAVGTDPPPGPGRKAVRPRGGGRRGVRGWGSDKPWAPPPPRGGGSAGPPRAPLRRLSL